MPNWSNSRIAIHLPTHEEDCWGEKYSATYAQRLERWEIFRDLKYHIQEECADGRSDDFNPFKILRPIPKDQEENWYDWCSENWGTKWDLCEGEGWVEGNTIILDGQTAWCPPIQLIQYLSDELGFDVEALHYSDENECWGETINSVSEFMEMGSDVIDEDDPLDLVALKLQDMEFELGRDLSWDDLTNYCLGRDLDRANYHFSGAWLDSDYIDCQVEWRVDSLMENFTNWKEEYGKEISEDVKGAKHKMIEMLDDLLESKQINEGQYLKACNHLKTVRYSELQEFKDMFLPLADKVEHDDNWDMVHYYRIGGEEPQLVEIYS
jgi:hypothetical protein